MCVRTRMRARARVHTCWGRECPAVWKGLCRLESLSLPGKCGSGCTSSTKSLQRFVTRPITFPSVPQDSQATLYLEGKTEMSSPIGAVTCPQLGNVPPPLHPCLSSLGGAILLAPCSPSGDIDGPPVLVMGPALVAGMTHRSRPAASKWEKCPRGLTPRGARHEWGGQCGGGGAASWSVVSGQP